MLGLLWLVLRIVLLLLGALLLLLVLALSVRMGVEAAGVNGDVTVDLRFGVLRLPLYPLPKKKEEKKPHAAQPKPEKQPQKKQKKYRYSLNREALDVGELIDVVLTLLDELSDTLRFSKLRVRVLIGTDDAAKTGMLLGAASAATGMIVPFLENTFDMKAYHVSVDADFDADHTEWAFTVFCSLRPIRLVFVLLRHSREYFRLYKRLIKKEEAIEHE